MAAEKELVITFLSHTQSACHVIESLRTAQVSTMQEIFKKK